MRHKKLLALSLFVLGADAALAEGFIEHEKHVHGQAELNIAIEKNDIEMELSSPAMNLLGFEYKPSSTEDKQQLAHTLNSLRQGHTLFSLGACELKDSDVSSTLLDTHHKDDHPEEKHTNASHDSEHDHDHDSEHAQKHQSSHSDFAVHYHFSCSEGIPAQIKTALFVTFPGLQHIAVTVLSEQQSQFTLNKSQNVIKLL